MKSAKRVMALAVAFAIAFALTACSQLAPVTVAGMAKKMEDIKSMSYTMSMDISMDVAGQSMDITTEGKGSVITEPFVAKVDQSMKMSGITIETLVYLAIIDGKTMSYTSVDGGKNWIAAEMPDTGSLSQYDPKANFDLFIKSAPSFKEAGEFKIDGVDTVRFDGEVSGDALSDVLAASGMEDLFASSGLDISSSDLFKNIGDVTIPISISIEKETCMPKSYTMDMTNMMNALIKNLSSLYGELTPEESEEIAGMSVGKVAITVTISEINKVGEIVIPEEALNAEPFDMDLPFDLDLPSDLDLDLPSDLLDS